MKLLQLVSLFALSTIDSRSVVALRQQIRLGTQTQLHPESDISIHMRNPHQDRRSLFSWSWMFFHIGPLGHKKDDKGDSSDGSSSSSSSSSSSGSSSDESSSSSNYNSGRSRWWSGMWGGEDESISENSESYSGGDSYVYGEVSSGDNGQSGSGGSSYSEYSVSSESSATAETGSQSTVGSGSLRAAKNGAAIALFTAGALIIALVLGYFTAIAVQKAIARANLLDGNEILGKDGEGSRGAGLVAKRHFKSSLGKKVNPIGSAATTPKFVNSGSTKGMSAQTDGSTMASDSEYVEMEEDVEQSIAPSV